ncbi:MAG TPA: sigma factor-like helix-turn-helix DNA-binding protein [Acidimicrobiales bacterium]|nr:sigma factor-like helix-turn-helix DNA-binding protein [Acidimicrobiales bacterium]
MATLGPVADIYPSMRHPHLPAERHDRLVALFEAHHVAVLGYLARRSATPEQAADAFSDVFLVAWRRLDAVPAASRDARLWLSAWPVTRWPTPAGPSGATTGWWPAWRPHCPVARSWRPRSSPRRSGRSAPPWPRLPDDDAELLRLVGWEGLGPSEAAAVLDLSPETTRSRLHRARARLRSLLDPTPEEVR